MLTRDLKEMTPDEVMALVKEHSPRAVQAREPSLITQMAERWGVSYETARQRIKRAQLAKKGMSTRSVKVHDDDWPKVKALVERLARERAAHEELARATRSPGA